MYRLLVSFNYLPINVLVLSSGDFAIAIETVLGNIIVAVVELGIVPLEIWVIVSHDKSVAVDVGKVVADWVGDYIEIDDADVNDIADGVDIDYVDDGAK